MAFMVSVHICAVQCGLVVTCALGQAHHLHIIITTAFHAFTVNKRGNTPIRT